MSKRQQDGRNKGAMEHWGPLWLGAGCPGVGATSNAESMSTKSAAYAPQAPGNNVIVLLFPGDRESQRQRGRPEGQCERLAAPAAGPPGIAPIMGIIGIPPNAGFSMLSFFRRISDNQLHSSTVRPVMSSASLRTFSLPIWSGLLSAGGEQKYLLCCTAADVEQSASLA